MTERLLTRRNLLKTTAAGAALGVAGLPLTFRQARAATTTIGFIYVGPKDDYGYNQAHAEGAKSMAALGGKIREEEKVPETVAVQ